MNRTIDTKRLIAARRADSWYHARLTASYTLADNELCAEMFRSGLLKHGMSYDETKRSVDQMDFHEVCERSKKLFTSDIALSNQVRNPRGDWMHHLSPNYIDEYILPFIDALSKVERFCDSISLEQTRGAYLPIDPVIDRIFLDTFSGVEGFVDFQKQYSLGLCLYDLTQRNLGILSFRESERSRIIVEALSDVSELVARKIFADLAERK